MRHGLLAPATEGTVDVDSGGVIALVDARTERLFGWSAGDLVGRPVDVLVADHHQTTPGPRPADVALLVSARRRDGSQFPAQVRLSTVPGPGAEPRVRVTLSRTSRLEPEGEGTASAHDGEQEAPPEGTDLAQLAAGIAHDLNNNLSVIMIYSDLLDRAGGRRALHEDLGKIRAAAECGAELTGRLAKLARLSREAPAVTGSAPAAPHLGRDGDLLLRAIRMRCVPEPVRESVGVVVVDDHRMFAESLARLLGAEDGIDVLGIGASGREAVALVDELRPRVLLLDFDIPEGNGVLVAAEIKRRWPATMVVMVTGSTDDRLLLRAIEAGCSGYLTKDRAVSEVAGAVRVVAAGEALFTPDQMARLLPKLARSPAGAGSTLSDRDREVLALMSRGVTNTTIATELCLSETSVRDHVDGILTTLHAHSRLEAVATAIREGVIDYNSPF